MAKNKSLLLFSAIALLASCGGGNVGPDSSSADKSTQEQSEAASSSVISNTSEGVSSASSEEATSVTSSSEEESLTSVTESSSEESSSSESSTEESSSEESSEEIAYTVTANKPGSSIVFTFLEEKESYLPGDTVSFTVKAASSVYEVTNVYYQIDGDTSYLKQTILHSAEGVYSFTMPEANITLGGETRRLGKIKLSEDHTTITLSEGLDTQTYYSVGQRVNFTVSVDEGYQLSSVKISGYDYDSKKNYSRELSEEDGGYTFLMYQGDVTITAVATEIPHSAEHDPWANIASDAYYEGKTTYNDSSNYTYDIYVGLVMHGNGTLDYYAYAFSAGGGDDWGGDYWALGGYDFRLGGNSSSDSVRSETGENVEYSLADDGSCLTFTWGSGSRAQTTAVNIGQKGSNGLPGAITIVEHKDNNGYFSVKNLVCSYSIA